MSIGIRSRWERVQEVLDGALTRPEGERAEFLAGACAGDAELYQEARDLLSACARAESFLEAPPADLAGAAFDGALPRGTRIGPYRIEREAGRGGMGVVYVAVRDDGQFEQRVALKLMSSAIEPESAARRIREERRILASLNHPEIARLIDGGVTDDGHPWFAMEFVEGTPIDVHCETHRLGIEARLEFFACVAEAVQYAHQNLVVHRDLKPSNIMVGADGTIKLLDFGVAKILTHDSDVDRETTGGASRWFTPHYASPEQVCGRPITTASDVYALGVLLYECLTGRPPHRIRSMVPAEISRAVCDEEPTRPSLVVLSGADAAAHGEARGLRPERLSRRLRGDLDTIIAKAMHKDPARRYSSAGALADDVRRHLARHPVLARPDSLAYRASKFVRRHRAGVVASAALLLSVLAGAAGIVWQARVAAVERDNAQQQAATAEQVSSLLVDMFRLSDADSIEGATVTAREVLARGARRIQKDFAGQPLLQASMLRELGAVYVNLGLHDDAEQVVRHAAAVWRQTARTPELAQALDQLGRINLARSELDSAEAQLREALALYQQMYERPHPSTASALGNLADVLRARRQHAPAESLYRAALAMERQLHGERDPHVATVLFDLAASLHDRGKFADAEPYFREALTLYRSMPGAFEHEAASALGNFAAVLLFREEYAQAEPLMREALALRKNIYKGDHPALVDAMVGLGTLLHNTSRFDEAHDVLTEALAMGNRVWGGTAGASHPQVMQIKVVLSGALHHMGRYADASRVQQEVLNAARPGDARDAPLMVYVSQLRGETDLARGDLVAARARFTHVVAEGKRLFGAAHPYIALGIQGLARTELAAGRADSAERTMRGALAMIEKTVRPNHRYLLGMQRTLAEALGAQARYAEADSLFRQVLQRQRTFLPAAHTDVARTLHGYGALHVLMGNATAAEPLLREALAIRRQRLGARHWEVSETQSVLGACLTSLGRLEAAEGLLTLGYEGLRRVHGNGDARTRRALDRLRNVQRRRLVATRASETLR